MQKRIFITGISGFIGQNLACKLVASGHQVSALVRHPITVLDERIHVIYGDLLNPESFKSCLEGIDIVFHCAACIAFKKKEYKRVYQANVEGTKNILEAALSGNVKKVVHLSACAVLGFSTHQNHILDESEEPEIPKMNIYSYTKRLAEKEVYRYVQKGLNVSIANISTVYGQGDHSLNSGSIISLIYKGKMKFTPPGGTSFVSVDDLVDGLLLLSEQGKPGERYIFCSENFEYKTLAKRIASALGVKGPMLTLPAISYLPALFAVKIFEFFSRCTENKINLVTTQILKETYGYKYFSSEKAKMELGWQPKQSLEETVLKAFSYYKKTKMLV